MTRLYEGGRQFAVKISGRDHVDLLHRVTSNDVKGLPVGGENFQCFLTAKGAIIVPFRFQRHADHVIARGPAELKTAFLETLDRYIFSEDVVLEPQGDIVLPDDEDARIRRGEPRWNVDITSETIPWEAGMTEYVSTSKGCYTGQETIARIETYGRVAWRLVKLLAVGDQPSAGELVVGEKRVGRVTSVTTVAPVVGLGTVHRDVVGGATVSGWQVSELNSQE